MKTHKYIAFLRGINVGGHHKVPMADLKIQLRKLKCENVITILNSGNIIFERKVSDILELENLIATTLEMFFGFPIPTHVREAKKIMQLLEENPFTGIEATKEIRRYVSFLKHSKVGPLDIPWASEDESFKILGKSEDAIYSVLDLTKSNTPKAMSVLEKSYGNDLTTRNWKTIERVGKKLGMIR